ncbi:hypothetical protein COCMIDRAFT_8915 [Bipolaris oryzae ATCC 44560]|uniref:DUF7888 domain-containing protein n=1 Tax=Bipolaris oryzae ATCC 44560 TaxID=930090 RepID=W6YUV8_COCMI|nr:uncharacterized protein COCMIDRAFT_8915 [Bipolaris oryzae ATCC 44560]EUC41348.1 hypothetical protein COCMIDRAFT_8915 [Bipolaris oryzae ATCC 44560]
MVQITSLFTLFAMGASVFAIPMVNVDTISVEQGLALHATNDNVVNVARSPAAGAAVAAIAPVVIDIATRVVQMIDSIRDDIERRKQFTQRVVSEVHARYPGFNVVVCNVGYKLEGSGYQNVVSTKYRAAVGADVTFDVVLFSSPKTFTRQGDGGFQNWAYLVGKQCRTNGGFIDCPKRG